MRVLHVIPDYGRDPVAMVFIHRQIGSLAPRGIQSAKYFLAPRNIRTDAIGAANALRQSIQRVDPDLVHVHFGGVLAFFVAIVTRRPIVVSYRGAT